MTSLLMDVKFDLKSKFDLVADQLPNLAVFDWNKDRPASLDGIQYMLCWQHERGLPASLPDLQVIFSAGAGVDHILSDEALPDVPVVRFVDPSLTTRMSEWIVLQCLMHLRQQRNYDRLQRQSLWEELDQPEAGEISVGIMGMGVLGQDAARKLHTMGFKVSGWSRSSKEIDGITCYAGDELDTFLARTDMLVGLLPHTRETDGMFNRELFSKLSRNNPFGGPFFINAGRGKSQVEADIIACLSDGTLKGVSLDVFETEPLSADSPLWLFENAILTPHAAAISDISALALYVAGQIKRFEAGEPLQNLVDRAVGY